MPGPLASGARIGGSLRAPCTDPDSRTAPTGRAVTVKLAQPFDTPQRTILPSPIRPITVAETRPDHGCRAALAAEHKAAVMILDGLAATIKVTVTVDLDQARWRGMGWSVDRASPCRASAVTNETIHMGISSPHAVLKQDHADSGADDGGRRDVEDKTDHGCLRWILHTRLVIARRMVVAAFSALMVMRFEILPNRL